MLERLNSGYFEGEFKDVMRDLIRGDYILNDDKIDLPYLETHFIDAKACRDDESVFSDPHDWILDRIHTGHYDEA